MRTQTPSKYCLMKKALAASTIILSFIWLSVISAPAQDDRQAKVPQPANRPANLPKQDIVLDGAEDNDYRLKPGDTIEIKVDKAVELSGVYALNTNGTFFFPVLGQVSGEKKTTEELSLSIANQLRGGYLTDPIVSVSVKERKKARVFPFFIQGAVHSPGTFQLERRPSLLKLITVAGGLSDNYGSTAFIIREKRSGEIVGSSADEMGTGRAPIENNPKSDPQFAGETAKLDLDDNTEYELIKVNINSLLRGNFENNIIIQPGDIVQIPRSDVFFVAGEVKAPGNFPLREGTTLRQAISLAQGTKFEGATNRSIIFREDQNGKRQEIPVDIAAVMNGKKDDVVIMPNDIIMVPNSRTKTLAKGMFSTLSGGALRLLLGF